MQSPSLTRLRKRLPLVVFILLAVLCLLLIGFACACAIDHPGQALDRALSALAGLPALVELWSTVVLSLALPALFVLAAARVGSTRASPARLQRFLL